MCGRFQLDFSDPLKYQKRFSIEGAFPKERIRTSYNIRPSFDIPVVVTHSPNSIEIMKWGFIPSYEERKPKPFGMINIRSDSLTKGWVHKELISNRCIIGASGFYEPKGPKGMKNRPQFYFKMKNDDYMGFAGIYREYKIPDGTSINTVAIITTNPNDLVGQVHDRMPAILTKDAEKEWLNPDNSEDEQLLQLLHPFKASEMTSWQVSLDINKRDAVDDHELIKPFKEEEQTQKSLF